jgi:hypothetical protein
MSKITPNIDWYGTYATASALADYLEVAAIAGVQLTRAAIADLIDDNEWSRRVGREHFTGDDDSEEKARDIAERIYNVIGERGDLLGIQYPFTLDRSGRLTFFAGYDHPYVALLAISVAHAARLDVEDDPTQVFEDTVSDVLRSRGWLAANFGRATRDAGFVGGLGNIAGELSLQPDAEGAPRSQSAQDEKVDTIAHFPWCRRRLGRWLTIGQVTCAVSNEWRSKLLAPSAKSWMARLGEVVEPTVFLAVPHHIESGYRTYLLNDSNRYILDRLSLLSFKSGISASEKSLIDAVMHTEVEQL